MLIHLVNAVTKLTTQHALDIKDLENKLQKQEERHVLEMKKIDVEHKKYINELKSK